MNEVITIELYTQNNEQYVFISHTGSSGCKYKLKSPASLGQIVADYVHTYLE